MRKEKEDAAETRDKMRLKKRIIEKYDDLIKQKTKELCDCCAFKDNSPRGGLCKLLPLTSEGENCPYFQEMPR